MGLVVRRRGVYLVFSATMRSLVDDVAVHAGADGTHIALTLRVAGGAGCALPLRDACGSSERDIPGANVLRTDTRPLGELVPRPVLLASPGPRRAGGHDDHEATEAT
ncbi:hypothetical protein EV188_101396 [Actinomycetospora succinea]|uniref:Uncharacterized protein n=2 Tax=Actinomycetospora succinea TaxID=663603 RepID=A0A4R6VRE9_9PSEU|nr:hypothetical protein EV188_101396 [Actinomycetospora succinea]